MQIHFNQRPTLPRFGVRAFIQVSQDGQTVSRLIDLAHGQNQVYGIPEKAEFKAKTLIHAPDEAVQFKILGTHPQLEVLRTGELGEERFIYDSLPLNSPDSLRKWRTAHKHDGLATTYALLEGLVLGPNVRKSNWKNALLKQLETIKNSLTQEIYAPYSAAFFQGSTFRNAVVLKKQNS